MGPSKLGHKTLSADTLPNNSNVKKKPETGETWGLEGNQENGYPGNYENV